MYRVLSAPSARLRSLVSGKNRFFSANGKFPKKPIILLDVDGVINMYNHANPSELWKDHIKVPVPIVQNGYLNHFNITFSPKLVRKLNKWNKIAEIRWLTTWDNQAITRLAPALKLREFKLAEGRVKVDESDDNYNATSQPKYLSKKDSAMATAAEVGPDGLIIWIDDELKRWTEDNKGGDDNAIFTRPNTVLLSPRCGLTKKHVAFIDNVLADPEVTKNKCVREFEEQIYDALDGFC